MSRTSWVKLIPPGKYTVQTEKGSRVTDMSEVRCARLAQNTNRAIQTFAQRAPEGQTPFRFPILIEHELEGVRLGDILQARYADLDKTGPALWVQASWTPIAWEMIQGEEVQHVSLGTNPDYEDETGEKFGEVLEEFSVVGHPLIKSIGRIQDHLALRASSKNKPAVRLRASARLETETMTDEQMKALIAALATVLQEHLAPLMVAIEALGSAAEDSGAAPADALEEALVELEADPAAAPSEEAVTASAEEEELEEQMNALIEEKEAMSARVRRLESALTKVLKRQKGLNFSERGGAGKPGAVKASAARLTGDKKVDALKKKGLTGEDLFKAYFKG